MSNRRSIRIEERDDRTIIFFRVRSLDQRSTRDLVPDLEGIDLAGRRVGIELRPIEFVQPFGLVYLYWYVRWLLEDRRAERVELVLDHENRDLCNYLKRMKLPDVFGDRPVTIYPIQHLQLRESQLAESLVELKAFRVDDDIVVEHRTSEIHHVIVSQCPHLGHRGEELHFAVSELLSNIEVHSRTRQAVVAVQAYRNRVELAFGDNGIGIRAALEARLPSRLADSEYILEALEPGVSSRPGGGGYGLTQLCETIEEEAGELTIRSGTGQVTLQQADQEAIDSCSPLPGTLVEVMLPV